MSPGYKNARDHTGAARLARLKVAAAANNSPRLLVAEFLRHNLPQLETQTVCYFLGQVGMRAAAEYFNVGHFVAVQGVVRVRAAGGGERLSRRSELGHTQHLETE